MMLSGFILISFTGLINQLIIQKGIAQIRILSYFFLVFAFQPIFLIVGHLSCIPSYYFFKKLGCAEIVGWLALGMLILLSFTHLSFLSIGIRDVPERTNGESRDLWCLVKDKFVSVDLIPALFITITYGLLEGILGVKVDRDRTIKDYSSGTCQVYVPTRSQNEILVRINRLEIAMSCYSIFIFSWSLCIGEVMVSIVCGILGVYYSINALISFKNIYNPKHFGPRGK